MPDFAKFVLLLVGMMVVAGLFCALCGVVSSFLESRQRRVESDARRQRECRCGADEHWATDGPGIVDLCLVCLRPVYWDTPMGADEEAAATTCFPMLTLRT